MIPVNQFEMFLWSQDKHELYDEFKKFCKSYDSEPSNEKLTKEIWTNVELKHKFAKYLVEKTQYDTSYVLPSRVADVRLQSFINYYIWTFVLNNYPSEQEISDLRLNPKNIGKGCWLDGNIIPSKNDPLEPVRMMPGDTLYPKYRVFVVNTLCFNSISCVLGIRGDFGPIMGQVYHKGCKEIGIQTDAHGNTWTLFKVDAVTTDDFTAVFSNNVDGEGTIEVCDYISDHDVRVLFRTNY